MLRGFSTVLLTAFVVSASAAHALVDVPTSERRALDLADLASSSGIAEQLDTSVLPLDDEAYLRVFRALQPLGLVDPIGELRDTRAKERADGTIHAIPLVPRVELRAYDLVGAEERLIHHSSGDVLRKGFNSFLSASGEAYWGNWLGGAYDVQLQESPGDFDTSVKRLYLKGALGKWSLKVGRDAVRLGPGYHGSLLLDDNAKPMDFWQVRTEEPLFLPGFLAGIGGFRFTLLDAYLSDSHPRALNGTKGGVEDPRLLAMRLSYHPATWLDLGMSRTALYSGKGRHTYDTPSDWWKLFSASSENDFTHGQNTTFDNDQYAAVDATVRMPFLNNLGPLKAGKAYWEHAGTDFSAPWQSGAPGRVRTIDFTRVSDLFGLYLSTAVTDLRAEYAHTNKEWYVHHAYPQGYTYQGLPLGHHMGGDAQDLFFEAATYFGPGWRAILGLDLEDRGRSLPVVEHRSEWTLGLEAYRPWGIPVTARIDALTANVRNALDDVNRGDRHELYLGVSVAAQL